MMGKEYSIAEIVDKSAVLVDKALKEKNISEKVVPYLYLSFASFYLFYGDDAVNTIFSVYRDSSFLLAGSSSKVLLQIDSRSNDSIEQLQSSIQSTVILSKSNDTNLDFHSTVHELNHLINSKRGKVVYEADSSEYFIRLGMQLMGVESGNTKNYYVNELINSYEAEEIEEVMFRYIYPQREKIQNKKIKTLLSSLDPDVYNRNHSYTFLQQKEGSIFSHRGYYSLLKRQLFEGDFEGIESSFEDFFHCSFASYSNRLDQFGTNFYGSRKRGKVFQKFFSR